MRLDTVYMIVCPDNKGVVYDSIALSAKESWRKVEEMEVMGTGVTKEILRKRGYRAKLVDIKLARTM